MACVTDSSESQDGERHALLIVKDAILTLVISSQKRLQRVAVML